MNQIEHYLVYSDPIQTNVRLAKARRKGFTFTSTGFKGIDDISKFNRFIYYIKEIPYFIKHLFKSISNILWI